tara:strand:- start:1375 stop:2511 length:1137 start_codon:yes stop_codon:yes gene_type:complete
MSDFLFKVKNLHWTLIFLITSLSVVGIIMIYSATNSDGLSFTYSQILKLLFGFIIMLSVGLVNINIWQKYSFILYILGVVILIYATFYGYIGKGSRRWINFLGINIQPSEIMKIFLILALAKFFDEKKIDNLRDYLFLIFPIVLVLIPFLIVLNQPDLGTSLILIFIGIVVFFIVGINMKFFISIFIIFLILSPIFWSSLHLYQKQRLLTFFDPHQDPLGTGYHIIQSQIAIGSGGFFGKGWLKGTQSHLDFLPEKKTDFIFSMLGEEFGFLGTISVIGLFILICFVGYVISISNEKNFFSKVIGVSIITNFFLAGALNMAMVMGLTPVVGIPLPLVSYGGSSMITYFFGFGLILSTDLSQKLYKEGNLNLINFSFFR